MCIFSFDASLKNFSNQMDEVVLMHCCSVVFMGNIQIMKPVH